MRRIALPQKVISDNRAAAGFSAEKTKNRIERGKINAEKFEYQ